MKYHELKTVNPFFEQVWDGTKRFELRKNDRDFQVGDFVTLKEYIPETKKYTGRSASGVIVSMVEDYAGLLEGYCILGFRRLDTYQ